MVSFNHGDRRSAALEALPQRRIERALRRLAQLEQAGGLPPAAGLLRRQIAARLDEATGDDKALIADTLEAAVHVAEARP